MRAGPIVAACLGAVASVAWWCLQTAGEAPPSRPLPPGDPVPATAPAVVADAAAKPAPTAVGDREVLAGDHADGALPAGCWRLQLKVVDALGEPVEGARVQLHHERQGPAFATLASDTGGLCSSAVRDDVVWVRADHEAVGRSTLLDVHAGMVEIGRPTRLLLLQPVVVRGCVLDANAMPMAHAKLAVDGRLWVERGYPGPCVPNGPVIANADGRFVFEAAAGASCSLRIVDDGRGTAKTTFEAGPGLDLLLAVAGAFVITGTVKDASGPVAAARLQVIGNSRRQGEVQSRADSTFTIACSGPCECRIMATTPGMASCSYPVELTVERPRAVVDMVLEPTLETRGRIVTQEGREPPAQLSVILESAAPAMFPQLRETLTPSFLLRLPRDSRWTVIGRGITPISFRAGDQDVCVAWCEPSGAQSASPVTSTVLEVFDGHGAPVREAKAYWRCLHAVDRDHTLRPDQRSAPPPEAARSAAELGGPAGSWHGNRLELAADQIRTSPWFLVVQDASLATAHIDFATEVPGGTRQVHLLPLAALTVRVQHHGTAMRGVDVVVEPCGEPLHERAFGPGGVEFAAVPSGPALVEVRRGIELLASREIELHATQRESLTIEVEF